MSRILLTAVLTALTTVAAFTVSDSASAQLVALRHHSTIAGDTFSGASELVRAQGQFLVDEAAAAETWVRVAAASDEYWYQRAEKWYQVKNMRLDYIQKKAEMNRERQNYEAATEENAALRILETAQRGVPQWPAALLNPKFAGSMTTIESLLRNWSPNDATGDAYRRALATEAGVLRTRVASDTTISHSDRVAAVQTLRQLQVLAAMPGMETAAGATQQLALR
jgi:hypothetical protein